MDAPAAAHPAEQTLRSYGLGTLDDPTASSVALHLESCADCRRRVAEAAPDSFLDRLRDAGSGSGTGAGTEPAPRGTMTDRGTRVLPPGAALGFGDGLPEGLADHPDYQVLRELGRGGMGVVYLARNKLMGREEVLKVMGRAIMERPGVLDRFLREIRAVARLRHPNIVTAYSVLRLGDSIAFAMEYVDGLDLARLVKSKGPLPVGHAAYFIHQAALGLQHAHEEGMVHRDVKPGNLMLARKGDRAVIKLLDFGLSKAASEQGVDGSLTHAGQMLGTPDYIAPEQTVDAQSADIRADMYSLGCTFYYLLTGSPPFRGTSLYDLLQAHHSMDAKPLNLVRTDVPTELAALVAKMMAKDPARRFQTPGEVARALTPFFKKPAATPPAPPVTAAAAPVAATPPAPAPAAEPEARWESLIEFKETERSSTPPPSKAKAKTPPGPPDPPGRSRRVALAAAGGVVGLVVLLGVVITIRHKDGSETKITADNVKSIGVDVIPDGAAADAAGAAAKPDGRRLWVDAGGHRVEQIGEGRWRETNQEANEPFYFNEVRRTPEYVELLDPTRFKGLTLRLYDDRGVVLAGDDPNFRLDWGGGHWDRTGPATAAAAESEPAPPTDGRWRWARPDGHRFEQVKGKRWREHTYNNFDFDWTEINRTPEYVELEDPTRYGGGRMRLFEDHADVQQNQFGPNFRPFRGTGGWDRSAPPPAPEPVAATDNDGWAPLFNGKDVTDWTAMDREGFNASGRWTVRGGILYGEGGASHLYSPRDDYADVRVRAEVKINAGGNSGLFVRAKKATPFPVGYEAQINSTVDGAKTGSLYYDVSNKITVDPSPVPSDKWFTLEVEAVGQRVRVFVNSVQTAEYTEASRPRGSIALQVHDAATQVQFSKIEVKELNRPAGSAASTARPVLAPADAKEYGGGWYKAFNRPMTWRDARAACAAMGGHLAYVRDAAGNGFVRSLARDAGLKQAWLGATDEAVEGVWLWGDGAPVAFTDWGPSQPTNRSTRGEPEHYLAQTGDGTWNDLPDGGEVWGVPGFVCQWDPPAAKTSSAPATPAPPTPPAGAGGAAAGGAVDLLARVDLAAHTVVGRWRKDARGLVSDRDGLNLVNLPYDPPAEYDLDVVAERTAGKNDLQVGFRYGPSRGMVILDGWGGTVSGLSFVDGYTAIDNETARRGAVFPASGPATIKVRLRRGSVRVTVDGRTVVDWRGLPRRLSVRPEPGEWKRRLPLFLGVQQGGGYRILSATLTPAGPAASAAAATTSTSTPADGSGWVSLFDGKTLTGWVVDSGPAGAWRVENGELVTTGPGDWKKGGFLLSDRSFGEFALRFEYRAEPGSNSGVTFWSAGGEAVDNVPHPIQVELFDANRPALPVGTLFWSTRLDVQSALRPVRPPDLKPPGEWNAVEVEARGGSLRVAVNGRDVLRDDLSDLASQPGAQPGLTRRNGRVGFQTHTGTVRFRNIAVKEFPPARRLSTKSKGRAADAVAFQGHHYKVFPDLVSWHDARERCRELGGHLAVVTSGQENQFLFALLRKQGVEVAWLGATDEKAEGEWVWVDGSRMAYQSWNTAVKQPNNKGGQEHYLVLRTEDNGLWSDQPAVSVQHRPGFVCEWE